MNRLVPAELEHMEKLAGRLRLADLAEIKVGCQDSPLDILLMSFTLSAGNVYTWLRGDEVVAVVGCAPVERGIGCPWFLGSDTVTDEPRFFVHIANTMIPVWLQTYPLLENVVHAKNEVSIRFLKWAGFVLEEPEDFGDTGEQMIHFYMERP